MEKLRSYQQIRDLYDVEGKDIELMHGVVSYDVTKIGVRKLFEDDFSGIVASLNKELELRQQEARKKADAPDNGFEIRVRKVQHQFQTEEEIIELDVTKESTDVTKENILGDLRETETVSASDKGRRSVSVIVPDPLQRLFDRKNDERNQWVAPSQLSETVNMSPVTRLSQGPAGDRGTPANGSTRPGPTQTSTVNKVLFESNYTWRASTRDDRSGGGQPPGGGGQPSGCGGHGSRGDDQRGSDRDNTLEVLKSNKLKQLINDVVEMAVTVVEQQVGTTESDILYAVNNLAHVQTQIVKCTDSFNNFVAVDPANEIHDMEVAGQMTPVSQLLQKCSVEVASRKAMLEDREKRSQQFQAENKKTFLSGKDLKFPVMLDK